ncbi:MAG: sugar phosphate isomerase/epimerase [Candidatus Omnitrophica bacterium]|nr:sugar phosphate isomerase/epimerase [Candidatus Omnitrophota bacterium]MCM8793479.1 sugar phosphate isomerase/epimerase [Candidatus Omnitrophota bacterium]
MDIHTTKLFVHIPYRILLNNLDKLAELGINVEIYIDGEGLDTYTDKEIDLINSFFAKYGLRKILHGPIYDLNPGSLDSHIRAISQERIRQTVFLCEKLNSDQIVFHHGFHHAYYRNHREKWLENSFIIWKPIVEYCLPKNINLAIENSFDPGPSIILELIEKINFSNFGACFDIGHFNAFGEKSPLEIFEEYPQEIIKEIHLSDNLGDFDTHLALGKGNINFREFLKLIEEKGIDPIITLEPHSLEDVKLCFEYLTNLKY